MVRFPFPTTQNETKYQGVSFGYNAAAVFSSAEALQADPAALDDLVTQYLEAAFPKRLAAEYLRNGIPPDVVATLKGVEYELEGRPSTEKKLLYIGNKSIAKYGCHGCHNIPGFEDAKPIGTTLADWGRKESSKLAFEHILEYLHGGDHGQGHVASQDESPPLDHADDHQADSHDAMTAGVEEGFDESFYLQQLAMQERSGFAWQKLKEPRSYDYKKTTNKKYNERLRMPLFPITPQQRQAVITFLLGLVADPPAEQFVYHPPPRQRAINEGREVVIKYNCKGCHIFNAEQWDLEFEPEQIGSPPQVAAFPFLVTRLAEESLLASATPDQFRGILRAHVQGMPAINDDDASPVIWDEEGDPIEEDEEYDPNTLQYPFDLWSPAALDGKTHEVGVRPLTVEAPMIRDRRPSDGGDLTFMLLPRVVELEKKSNPAAKGTEAWGWLPPPLIGQGRKVQPQWLHDFLLDPYPIRPAVFLRMPRFNMSPDEASQLVDYFAARDDVDYPYSFNERTRSSHLAATEEAFHANGGAGMTRLDQAMKIVTNSNYCVKCHLIGGFVPEGSERALAPDLVEVQRRLRPEFVRNWIANPKRILPYTNMPENIPYNPNDPHLGGVSQELFPGTSVEQLDALVDLLMNYGDYTSQKNDVAALVKAGAAEAPADASGEQAEPGGESESEAATTADEKTAAAL